MISSSVSNVNVSVQLGDTHPLPWASSQPTLVNREVLLLNAVKNNRQLNNPFRLDCNYYKITAGFVLYQLEMNEKVFSHCDYVA